MKLTVTASSLISLALFAGTVSPALAEDDLVKRGEYLSVAAGCQACHQGDDTKPFAGGLILKTPFGNLASPNITQDEKTGIGKWTAENFEAALRRGENEEGDPLYPAMPYMHYTKIPDEDIDALWAYVQTIEPIENEVEVNLLPFPFDVRASLYVWQAMFFTEERFEPVADKDEEWNRGYYLVEALAHCSSCHTPRNAMGGPIESKALTGARIEEWYAPDISNGPGSVIEKWSVDDLTSFLSGESKLNHAALGSMSEVVKDMSIIRDDDVRSIAVYLKDRVPQDEQTDTAAKSAAHRSYDNSLGEEIFTSNCASCHGKDGEGNKGVAASLVGSGTVNARNPINIVTVLLRGIAPNDNYGLMPSFRDVLDDSELARVTNYIRTDWGNEGVPNASRGMVSTIRKQTETNSVVRNSATCPNVPSASMDDETRKALAGLAQKDDLATSDIVAVADAYSERHPDVKGKSRMLQLSSIYCQELARSGAEKDVVIRRELDFMNAFSNIDG